MDVTVDIRATALARVRNDIQSQPKRLATVSWHGHAGIVGDFGCPDVVTAKRQRRIAMSQVVQEAGSDCAVYRFVGELDALTAPRLRQVLARMESSSKAVIDLSDVVFIDSTGLNALVGGIRRIRERGGQIAVSSNNPRVRRLLTLTGFEKIVPLGNSVEDAAEKLVE